MNAGKAQNNSRARLQAAALEVFNEVGVNAASIHDICARAQVSIGSAYHHFGSKQGLADHLLIDGLQQHLDLLEPRLAVPGDARTGVVMLIHSLIEWVEAHPDWARYIYAVADQLERAPAVAEQRAAINRRYAACVQQRFGADLDRGLLGRWPPVMMASLIIGPVHDYARRYLAGQVSTPPSEVAPYFVDAAWCLLRPE